VLALPGLVAAAGRAAVTDKPKPKPKPYAWVQGFKPAFAWSWRESVPASGSRFLTKLAVGKFVRVRTAPTLAGFKDANEVASNCPQFDASTDGVAPAALQVTNETKGRSIKLDALIFSLDPTGFFPASAQPAQLFVAAGYAGGPQCYPISDPVDALRGRGQGWRVAWSKPIKPRKSPGTHYAYLVIPGLFDRKHPAGNPARLREALLTIEESGYSPARRLDSLTGPGIFRSPSGDVVRIIPLDGKRSCLYRRGQGGPQLVCGLG